MESPHRRRYSIQPAASGPAKPMAPATDASRMAPARRVTASPPASAEPDGHRFRLRRRRCQRSHRLLERLRIVPVPPRQEAGAQGPNRLLPALPAFVLHLAHSSSPPPHGSLLFAERPAYRGRQDATIAFSPLSSGASKCELGSGLTRADPGTTGRVSGAGPGRGVERADAEDTPPGGSYLDHLEVPGGAGRVAGRDVVEDETGARMPRRQRLRLFPARVHSEGCGLVASVMATSAPSTSRSRAGLTTVSPA